MPVKDDVNVMQNLQGRNKYSGCILYIKFSHRSHLIVRRNHHMSLNFQEHPIIPETSIQEKKYFLLGTKKI